jgi:hypothetical protein
MWLDTILFIQKRIDQIIMIIIVVYKFLLGWLDKKLIQ